jgi:hypothetical protein
LVIICIELNRTDLILIDLFHISIELPYVKLDLWCGVRVRTTYLHRMLHAEPQNIYSTTRRAITTHALLRPLIEISSALSRINVIAMIEKRRWKWLGHFIRMNSLRNPHQCLTILDDFRPGNLLAHLPPNIRSVASRLEAANSNWMTKTYFERISLNTQCP